MTAAKKVLVVDDDADVVSLITLLLKTEGYQVSTAVDGLEALEKARSENPSLIILDVMLPRLDGYKVCRVLKFDEKYSNIPIILLTAKIQDKDKRMGAEVGADLYVTKPFDNASLLEKVKEILRRRESG